MRSKKFLFVLVIAMLVLAVAATGCGTKSGAKDAKKDVNYPTKPVTMIVGFGAGGATDLLARATAGGVSKYLGQPVVVENKPGASGTIGTDYVLKSKPDGYTILSSSSGNFTSTPIVQGAPYDPNKDVRHVINIAYHPILLLVHVDAPWKTIEEFVAYVKQNPGKVSYGQNSPGGTAHMALEMFRKAAGLDMKSIPHGGGGSETIAALLGKHVDVGIMHPQEVSEHMKSGKIRALVVYSEKRLPSMPDVPTAKEKGYDVVLGVPKGIAVPAGTPDEIVVKLHDAFKKMMNDEDFKAAAKKSGDYDYLEYMSGEDTAKVLQKMYKDMEPLLTELGLKKK